MKTFAGLGRQFNFYTGIDNVLDTHPPLGLSGTGTTGITDRGTGNAAIYDAKGRFLYAGFKSSSKGRAVKTWAGGHSPALFLLHRGAPCRHASAMNRIEQAYQFAGRRETNAAVALLEAGGRGGDAGCWIELAHWHLAGTIIPRNLASMRECFRLAGEAGDLRGCRIYLSLVASGTGGPADWRAALAMLESLSEYDDDAARQLALLGKMTLDEHGRPCGIAPAERLSTSPDVLLFRQFLTGEECHYLVDQSMPLFQPSVVVDPASGQLRPHPVRTSDNAAFPWVDETPFIHAINQRIAAASGRRRRTASRCRSCATSRGRNIGRITMRCPAPTTSAC